MVRAASPWQQTDGQRKLASACCPVLVPAIIA